MKSNKAIIILLILTTFTGCASLGNFFMPKPEPGEKMLDLHEEVWRDYNCKNETLPIVKIEESDLEPNRLDPEKKMECNHRLIYGLCCDKLTNEITGRLFTRIFHRGQTVVNDIDENYILKPGRWQVDTFIVLPEEAESGVYSLEIEFISSNSDAGFKVDNTFIVEPRDDAAESGEE